MKPVRTRAYWPTRILLAFAIVIPAMVLVIALWTAVWLPVFLISDDRTFMGVPDQLLTAAIAAVMALVGLVWSIRIYRGPREEPPAWRYRDR
jgi:hypothetical protein